MSKGENKTALINLLLSEWENDKYAPRLQGRLIYSSNKGVCTLLSSEDGLVTDSQPVHNLSTSQEEADMKIILHSLFASSDPYNDYNYDVFFNTYVSITR